MELHLTYDELLVMADAVAAYIKDLSHDIISNGREDLKPTRDIARGLLVKTVAAQTVAQQNEKSEL